ncbi:hypothetical protein SCLCIDRAFT_1219950 [Scleroderma citrinum Foug A]|uniref:Uncharacterized protein n=1 Tax=Scleroderma citrinum Foug A TaxID=1036808 RepID=A0A0C3DLH4_9AGAM|nr:hypothetical protein SCLCIDRAFT_1219950 [Scleroderma citrinum Foug A]
MLARASFLHRTCSTFRRRCYSAAAIPDYHPKVRAIPFAFSPDVAITHVGVTAALIAKTYSSPAMKEEWGRLIGSFFAKYFSWAGFKAIQPERMQALYYPSWCIDAEAEAKAWFSDTEDRPESVTVQFRHAELPGLGMELGRISLRGENPLYEHTQSFSSSLTRQHGVEVHCLPYNIDPLELLSRVDNLSYGPVRVDDQFRFDPRSIKFNLVAAYPVLLPVYVLQYVPMGPYPRVTIIVEAHSEPGRHYVHFVGDPNLRRLPAQEYLDDEDFIPNVSPSKCRFSPHLIAPRGHADISEELCSWMSTFFEDSDAAPQLTSKKPVNMADHRVREWTKEEVLPVQDWMQLGEDVVRLRGMIKVQSGRNSLSGWLSHLVDSVQYRRRSNQGHPVSP